jgi:hypothetical protein
VSCLSGRRRRSSRLLNCCCWCCPNKQPQNVSTAIQNARVLPRPQAVVSGRTVWAAERSLAGWPATDGGLARSSGPTPVGHRAMELDVTFHNRCRRSWLMRAALMSSWGKLSLGPAVVCAPTKGQNGLADRVVGPTRRALLRADIQMPLLLLLLLLLGKGEGKGYLQCPRVFVAAPERAETTGRGRIAAAARRTARTSLRLCLDDCTTEARPTTPSRLGDAKRVCRDAIAPRPKFRLRSS